MQQYTFDIDAIIRHKYSDMREDSAYYYPDKYNSIGKPYALVFMHIGENGLLCTVTYNEKNVSEKSLVVFKMVIPVQEHLKQFILDLKKDFLKHIPLIPNDVLRLPEIDRNPYFSNILWLGDYISPENSDNYNLYELFYNKEKEEFFILDYKNDNYDKFFVSKKRLRIAIPKCLNIKNEDLEHYLATFVGYNDMKECNRQDLLFVYNEGDFKSSDQYYFNVNTMKLERYREFQEYYVFDPANLDDMNTIDNYSQDDENVVGKYLICSSFSMPLNIMENRIRSYLNLLPKELFLSRINTIKQSKFLVNIHKEKDDGNIFVSLDTFKIYQIETGNSKLTIRKDHAYLVYNGNKLKSVNLLVPGEKYINVSYKNTVFDNTSETSENLRKVEYEELAKVTFDGML